ncbi:MAG: hypothetical protein ACM3JI_00895 [Anaerolineae bacterium]
MTVQGFAFIPIKTLDDAVQPFPNRKNLFLGTVAHGSKSYLTYAVLKNGEGSLFSEKENLGLEKACKKIQKCLDYLPSFCKGPECWGEAGFRFKGIRIPNTFETANISECGKDVFERCKTLIERHLTTKKSPSSQPTPRIIDKPKNPIAPNENTKEALLELTKLYPNEENRTTFKDTLKAHVEIDWKDCMFLGRRLLGKAFDFNDLESAQLLLKNGVLFDYQTTYLPFFQKTRSDTENQADLESLEILLWEGDQKVKLQSCHFLDRLVEKIIEGKKSIEILHVLVNAGVTFNAYQVEPTDMTKVFNRALQHALKVQNTELLSLTIAAGAFPNAESLEILENQGLGSSQDSSIRDLIAKATRAILPRFEWVALKDSTTQFIQFLIEEKAITTESLWKFTIGRRWMSSGINSFKPGVVEELISSRILTVEEAKTCILDEKINVSSFIKRLGEKKYEKIFSKETVSELINDPKILKKIVDLEIEPSSYAPLILDETLNFSMMQRHIAPERLKEALKGCPSLKQQMDSIPLKIDEEISDTSDSIQELNEILSKYWKIRDEKEKFKDAVKKALSESKAEVVNSQALREKILEISISIGDVATLKLLLESEVQLLDNWLWFNVLIREDKKMNETVSQMIDLLIHYGRSSEKFMTLQDMTFSYFVGYIIDGKSDIDILKKIMDAGVKNETYLNHSMWNCHVDAFDKALEHAIKTKNTELLALVVKAGAFPIEESYLPLKNCKNPSILKIVKEADPAFESRYLQTAFKTLTPPCSSEELEDVKTLVNDHIISKEALEKFITEGRTKFRPKDIEELVKSNTIDIQAAKRFIHVFGLSRLLKALDEGRCEEIFSRPFALACLQDEAMIKTIVNRFQMKQMSPVLFASLIVKKVLLIEIVKPLITPDILQTIRDTCVSEELNKMLEDL